MPAGPLGGHRPSRTRAPRPFGRRGRKCPATNPTKISWWPQRDWNVCFSLERASPWVVVSPTSTPGATTRCHSRPRSAPRMPPLIHDLAGLVSQPHMARQEERQVRDQEEQHHQQDHEEHVGRGAERHIARRRPRHQPLDNEEVQTHWRRDQSDLEPHDHNDAEPDRVEAKLDRKSTRLNSSHRTISYAVFCLKKKK